MDKKKALLIPAIMAIANSAFMSLIMCLINVGIHGPFFAELLKSFVIGLIVTTPISYALPPMLNKWMK